MLAYGPALRAGFIWNDSDYVTNPTLRSLHGLWRIWFEVGATEQYYPVLHTAFWIEHRLWGDQALGYHLTNVLLHAGAACLLAANLRRWDIPGAWLAAFFFALHPVGAESVAWISEGKNTLSLLFYLLAALAYTRFEHRRTWGSYLIASGLFAVAVLSKSVTATLPGALLVLVWWKRGCLEWRRDVGPLIPWFCLGAAVGLFTGWVERHVIGAAGSEFVFTPVQRCLIAGRMIWFYLGKLIWPADLAFVYPRWEIDAGAAWQYLFPVGAVALIAGLWLLRHRGRGPLAAMLFFVGSLFPTLGFFNIYFYRYSYVGDHFQYLASLGVFSLGGAGVALALSHGRGSGRLVAPAASVAIALLIGAMTWRQAAMFTDNEVLWRTTLERNPACWLAQNHLGVMASEAGRADEAIGRLTQVLNVRPNDPDVHSNLGSALLQANRTAEAIVHFHASLHLKPDSPECCNNLGNAFLQLGRLAEAGDWYRKALRLNPGFALAYSNLGSALLRSNRPEEGLGFFEIALRLRPDYAEAENNLGSALVALRRNAEAFVHYEAALRLKPDYAEAQNNFGIALGRAGHYAEASEHFAAAIRLKPDYADARENLAALSEFRQRNPSKGK